MATVEVGTCTPCCSGVECGPNLCERTTPRTATLTVPDMPQGDTFAHYECTGAYAKVFPLELTRIGLITGGFGSPDGTVWAWSYADDVEAIVTSNSRTPCTPDYTQLCDTVVLPRDPPSSGAAITTYYFSVVSLSHFRGDIPPNGTAGNAGTLSLLATVNARSVCSASAAGTNWMGCDYRKSLDANDYMTYSEDDSRWYLDPCELSVTLPFFFRNSASVCDCTAVEVTFDL